MAVIIDGKICAKKILDDIKERVSKLDKKPCLAVILANNDSSSKIYVASKEKRSIELGFNSKVYRFDETITQDGLNKLIKELNQDPEVNGILVQLPLYNHLNSQEIIELIDPKKDVDGFHPINAGRLSCGLIPEAICCTPKGVIKLLKEYSIDIVGKNALVIGRSNIVGKPTANLLINENATVALAHSKTKNLKELCLKADIIVSATGCAKLIKKDMVKQGAVVIDIGISKQQNGSLIGDVDFEEVKEVASYITPVPGGVGPMTIACLMENTYELYLKQNK